MSGAVPWFVRSFSRNSAQPFSGLWVGLEGFSVHTSTASVAQLPPLAASRGGCERGWMPRALRSGRLAAEAWPQVLCGSFPLRWLVTELPRCWPLRSWWPWQWTQCVMEGMQGRRSPGWHGQALPCQGAAWDAVKVSVGGKAALHRHVLVVGSKVASLVRNQISDIELSPLIQCRAAAEESRSGKRCWKGERKNMRRPGTWFSGCLHLKDTGTRPSKDRAGLGQFRGE